MAVYNYQIKVQLKGFLKDINRTYLVNDNIKLDTFCQAVITTMNGDLSHLYSLTYKDKIYVNDRIDILDKNYYVFGTKKLSLLNLSEKDKMKLLYDYGDDWEFIMTVMKVVEGHNNKKITLIKGKGKGIEVDCGGICGLSQLIENKDNEWGYNIDDFDLEQLNRYLEVHYNRRKPTYIWVKDDN